MKKKTCKEDLKTEYRYARVMRQIKFALQRSNLIINVTFDIIIDIIRNHIEVPMITRC